MGRVPAIALLACAFTLRHCGSLPSRGSGSVGGSAVGSAIAAVYMTTVVVYSRTLPTFRLLAVAYIALIYRC